MKRVLAIVGFFALLVAGSLIIHRIENPPSAHAASQFANIICDNYKPLSLASGTTQIVTAGNANMFVYICSYNVSAAVADNFSIIEGTGASCGTGTAAVVGSTTAAAGINMAANGNINFGGGSGAVAKTAVAGDNVCFITSSAGPLSGVIGYTTAPF